MFGNSWKERCVGIEIGWFLKPGNMLGGVCSQDSFGRHKVRFTPTDGKLGLVAQLFQCLGYSRRPLRMSRGRVSEAAFIRNYFHAGAFSLSVMDCVNAQA